MKKILITIIMIFIVSLCGCQNYYNDEDEIIDFSSVNTFHDNVFVDYVCMIANTKQEFDNLVIEEYLEKYYEEFDYDNYSLVCFSIGMNNVFSEEQITELKVYKNSLIIDLHIKNYLKREDSVLSFIIEVAKKDVVGIQEVIVKENQYNYIALTVNFNSGGCISRVKNVYVPKNKKAHLEHDLINLNTLEVYKEEVVFNETMYLYNYTENGIYGLFLRNYIMENNQYNFEIGYTSLEILETYNIVERNDDYLVIDHDNVLYTFIFENGDKTNLRLYAIGANNKLFNKEYQESKNILSILYNNENEFENDYISVQLDENSYKIVFETFPIFG